MISLNAQFLLAARSHYITQVWQSRIIDFLFSQIPRQVSGESGFYILDPDNNLPDSRTRFERFLGDFNWEGMVGKGPEQVDVERAVTQRDLFVWVYDEEQRENYNKRNKAMQRELFTIFFTTFFFLKKFFNKILCLQIHWPWKRASTLLEELPSQHFRHSQFGYSSWVQQVSFQFKFCLCSAGNFKIEWKSCKCIVNRAAVLWFEQPLLHSLCIYCSVRMRPMGIGLDGKSVAHDFARRSCPCVIGTLWTVTDGEIDKFLMKMVCLHSPFILIDWLNGVLQLQMIFSHEDNLTVEKVAVKRADEESRKRLRIFSESMHRARYFCKLPYLTGAAVICYGVPLVAKPVSLENFKAITNPTSFFL